MGTPTRERVACYRERLRERGYRSITVYLPVGAHERLLRLATLTGKAHGDLIADALERYEATISQACQE